MSEKMKTQAPAAEPKTRRPDTMMEILMSEGGFSLLIIFPLVLFYFFSMAIG